MPAHLVLKSGHFGSPPVKRRDSNYKLWRTSTYCKSSFSEGDAGQRSYHNGLPQPRYEGLSLEIMLILCINPRTCFLPTYKTFCSVIARKRQVEVIWSSWLWLMPPPCILPSLPASNSSSDALPFLLPFTFAPTHSHCTPVPEDGKTV